MANEKATPPESTEPEEVDAIVVDDDEGPGTAVTPIASAPPASTNNMAVATLWNTHDAGAIVDRASKVATALKDVIDKQGMKTSMGARDHVNIEGWQTAGTLLGLQAIVVDTRRIEPKASFEVKSKRKKWGGNPRKIVEETENSWTCTGYSYEAVAEVRTMDGRVVGRAEATCSREESKWAESDEYAVKSMAQTRACSRGLRQALGFIVGMAGYATTPTEEMPGSDGHEGDGPGGPPFGEEATKEAKGQALRALAFLLQHDGAPDQDAALEVIAQIKERAGDYFPAIVGKAIGLTAVKLKEVEPELADNVPDPGATKDAEAKADAKKQDAAEEGDPPAPAEDTPPAETKKPEGERDSDEIDF